MGRRPEQIYCIIMVANRQFAEIFIFYDLQIGAPFIAPYAGPAGRGDLHAGACSEMANLKYTPKCYP